MVIMMMVMVMVMMMVVMMISVPSLGMTADLIGEETSSSALVFGLMSLTDKVFGLIVHIHAVTNLILLSHTYCIFCAYQCVIIININQVANGLGIVLIQGQVPCVKVKIDFIIRFFLFLFLPAS